MVWDLSNSPNSARGLRGGIDGNIYAVYYNILYKINYKNAAGLAKVVIGQPLNSTDSPAGISPGVDSLGNVYIGRVVADGTPLKVYDKNLTYQFNAVDTLMGFSRSMEVSKNGLDIYWAGYAGHAILNYKSTDGGLSYGKCDTILKGMDCESFGWNRKNNYLWVSAGSYNDLPNRWPGLTTSYSPGAWYAYDPVSKTVKDSIKWVFAVANNVNERPRGITFSKTGDTAYVCVYSSNTFSVPGVRMYKRTVTGLEQSNVELPTGYTLSQNYPNPFNPTTEIQFTISKSNVTSLKVYDMLGREVATLVNQNLAPGSYKYGFNATNLASGSYVYQLTSGDIRMTRKMTLVK
jgi:hypothetical protein